MSKHSLSCGHNSISNFSQNIKGFEHYYCNKCGMHYYKNREWTKKEWEIYVEDFSYTYQPEVYFK